MSDRLKFTYMFTAFRVMVACLLLTHGIVRFLKGGIPEFGAYLDQVGFVFGFYVAALLTLLEIVSGLLIILGRGLNWAIAFFLVELIAGIILVHGPEGWFVVGYGRNGSEYSVLLIVSLLLVWANGPQPLTLFKSNDAKR